MKYGRGVVVVVVDDDVVGGVAVVLGVDPKVIMVTMVGFRVAPGGRWLTRGVGETSKTGFGPLVAGTGLSAGVSTIGLSDRLTEGRAVGDCAGVFVTERP